MSGEWMMSKTSIMHSFWVLYVTYVTQILTTQIEKKKYSIDDV